MFSFLERPGSHGLGVAFTDREGGVSEGAFASLNLGRIGEDDLDHVRENIARVRRELGVEQVVRNSQVHGATVVDVDPAFLAGWGPDHYLGFPATGERLTQADALVTTQRSVALCVLVGDCVPVLFADDRAGVIGAAHAGRVGLDAGVLVATVRRMRELGASAITAWIGPHICGACYEVPEQMRDEIASRLPGAYATTSWGTPALDLGQAAERQLRQLDCQVHRRDPCTRTEPALYSHRRDGDRAGRLAGLVWLAP